MQKRRMLFSVALAVTLSGCTNFLYHDVIDATDTTGVERRVMLYWQKTQPLIGAAKAGPASLVTECSSERLTLEDRPEGVIYRGSPDRDRLPGSDSPVRDGEECARLLDLRALRDFSGGDVLLQVRCEPLPGDEFALVPPIRIRPQAQPYRFDMQEEKQWSLLGSAIEPPSPPECRQQQAPP